MHHWVRLDGDDPRPGLVIAHVDAGSWAQFNNGAAHRSDHSGLALPPCCMAVFSASVEQSRLEP